MAQLKIYVQAEIKDVKTGKLLRRSRKKLCHSYIIALINILRCMMNYSADASTTDTSDASKTLGGNYGGGYRMYTVGGAGDATLGIQAGTGTQAIAITDNKLKTLILHGDTSTKLNYGATSVGLPATVGTTRSFTISRTLTNNSGADIIVNEVGLVVSCHDNAGGNPFFLIEHSLLTFTITTGTSGTVTYTISATV